VKEQPYEIISSKGSTQTRLFKFDSDDEELKWHRDRERRIVRHVSGEGWWIQLDDHLPQPISQGFSYEIPAGVWHRAIKGENPTDLVVEIQMFM
jgi:hypothetical protein